MAIAEVGSKYPSAYDTSFYWKYFSKQTSFNQYQHYAK